VAFLERARLGGARMKGATADEHTAFPEKYNWRRAGVIHWGEDTEANGP
jgi:hypothetical protein